MTAIALEPHADDITLFASYTAIAHNAHVITILRGHIQAQRGSPITAETREAENDCAMHHLGLDHEQWPFSDANPDWGAIRHRLEATKEVFRPALVIAPAVEPEGHEQHNRIGELAVSVFGPDVIRYLTYRRGHGRSLGVEAEIRGDWLGRKLRALACFESQIDEPTTRPWFLEMFTTREWLVA